MKGGRTAPRKEDEPDDADSEDGPSMKGGRTAPRKRQLSLLLRRQRRPFNEGGADCPPKDISNRLSKPLPLHLQ